jgi:hypothetical protein
MYFFDNFFLSLGHFEPNDDKAHDVYLGFDLCPVEFGRKNLEKRHDYAVAFSRISVRLLGSIEATKIIEKSRDHQKINIIENQGSESVLQNQLYDRKTFENWCNKTRKKQNYYLNQSPVIKTQGNYYDVLQQPGEKLLIDHEENDYKHSMPLLPDQEEKATAFSREENPTTVITTTEI